MVDFDEKHVMLFDCLGISPERADEIMSHDFCGLTGPHTNFQHIKAVLGREDITEAERLLFMFGMGHNSAYDDLVSQAVENQISIPSEMVH